jgi:tetraprenyl-beta-curcumene synthase
MYESISHCLSQTRALVGAVAHELLWALPNVVRDANAWRARALTIPDAALREDALELFASTRANADGAALFSILPRRRNLRLLHLLVAYEFMADFLDSVDERRVFAGASIGPRLHSAMIDAVDFERTVGDYYCRRWVDGGYLNALVGTCRESIGSLPSYVDVRSRVIRVATLAQVQSFNHEPDPGRRDTALRRWAAREFPDESGLSWFELSGSASAWLGAHALLALAAEPTVGERDGADIYDSYRWISLAGTMLDSLGDLEEDLMRGVHSYIAHYPSREIATRRVCEFLKRSTSCARTLPNPHRHAVIVACMMAMYLSKDSVRTPQMRATTASLVRAGGPLAGLLVPVLRIWRIAYGQQSA